MKEHRIYQTQHVFKITIVIIQKGKELEDLIKSVCLLSERLKLEQFAARGTEQVPIGILTLCLYSLEPLGRVSIQY